jgi:pseudouridylate synthase
MLETVFMALSRTIALESTILSHGLPCPQNYEKAFEWEALVRSHNITPKTIAVLSGKPIVGLSDEQILDLCKQGNNLSKLSSYDLPWAYANKLSGSTTLAGTMNIAHQAGIRVVVTGGIGGVHRGFENHWDVSHDLECLSYFPLIVVSAGAKSILDIENTLEYLETKGVLVIGWQTDEFPAFFYQSSGIKIPYRADSIEDISQTFKHSPRGAILVVNPIPKKDEIPKEIIEPQIKIALQEAKQKDIVGKALTPFLLSRIQLATDGLATKCNFSLYENNIRLATRIAHAL